DRLERGEVLRVPRGDRLDGAVRWLSDGVEPAGHDCAFTGVGTTFSRYRHSRQLVQAIFSPPVSQRTCSRSPPQPGQARPVSVRPMTLGFEPFVGRCLVVAAAGG